MAGITIGGKKPGDRLVIGNMSATNIEGTQCQNLTYKLNSPDDPAAFDTLTGDPHNTAGSSAVILKAGKFRVSLHIQNNDGPLDFNSAGDIGGYDTVVVVSDAPVAGTYTAS